MVRGFGNVNIRQELIDLIKLLIMAKDVPHSQVAAVIQEAIVEYLSRRGYYPKAPRFEHISVSNERFIIKDAKYNSMISIIKKNKALFCEYDSSIDCDHVKFAKEIPEIRSMIKEKKLNK